MLGWYKSDFWAIVEQRVEAMKAGGGFDKEVANFALPVADRVAKILGVEAPARTQVLADVQVSTPEDDAEPTRLREERRKVARQLLQEGGIGRQPPKPAPIDMGALMEGVVDSHGQPDQGAERSVSATERRESEPEVVTEAVDG